MGKHLRPGTLEPKCCRLSRNAVTRKFENILEEKCQPPTLEPNMPRKHTIYKMSAHTIVTHTQTRGTIGRVSGRKVSTSSPKRIEVSGRNRPSDRKKRKNKMF